MQSLLVFLKAAADAHRLRILRLLLLEDALNVGELTRILGIAQSSVSQKLRALRKAGLVDERREGGFTYYALSLSNAPTLAMLRTELAKAEDAPGDLARLAEVRRERRDRGGGGRLLEPGRSWVAWARALRFVLPRLRVADFGCGDGALTVEIAAWARSVVAIERSPQLVAAAQARLVEAGIDNVELIAGELASVELTPTSVDLVVISHTLHYMREPAPILRRAHEMLVPGGRVLLLELAEHREEWVRTKLNHERLGFSPAELERALADVGFASIDLELTPRRAAPEPFRIVIASAVKPAGD